MFLLWKHEKLGMKENLLHTALQVDLTCDETPRQLGPSSPISKARLNYPTENNVFPISSSKSCHWFGTSAPPQPWSYGSHSAPYGKLTNKQNETSLPLHPIPQAEH